MHWVRLEAQFASAWGDEDGTDRGFRLRCAAAPWRGRPRGEAGRTRERQTALIGPVGQRICIPEIAREMTSRWISEVPSKMV